MPRWSPFVAALAVFLVLLSCLAGRRSEPQQEPQVTAHDAAFHGGTLHFLVAGPDSGRPVLLLHGRLFSSATWESSGLMRRLAKEGFRAVAVDLPGYGASSPAPDLPPEAVLSTLIPTLGLDHPVVVAPSLAGRYVFPLLVGAPDTVSALVLVAPAGIRTYRAVLGDLRLPVLLVWGDKDDVVPIADSYLLTARWPQAQRLVLQDAGHAAYLDRPEEFNDAVIAFLDSASAASPEGRR